MDSRFFQANERTLLAWLRTGLGLSAFGFAVAKSGALIRLLAPSSGAASPAHAGIGIALVLVGVMAMLVGLARYLRVRAALLAGRDVPESAAAIVIFSILTIAVALGLAISQLLT